MRKRLLFAVVLGLVASTAFGAAISFSAAGADAASIQSAVDAYRAALGPLNPNTAGSFATGRREINWDGVPDAFSAPNNLPANFFNVNSPRGGVFSTPGTGFQVSANAGVAPIEFANINPTYASIFQTFSPQRLFTALGSSITDVNFFVPGSTTPATTSGFGAVFTDVDNADTTSIQFFDAVGGSLGTFFVPPADNGLSFLGIVFNAGERVGRVRITSGNIALGPNDAPPISDAVAMDDFIYGEPQGGATPTPTATLTSTASPTPTLTATLTSTPNASASPTLTATANSGGPAAPGTIPTLSPGMLALLVVGLATVAILLIRRG